MNSLWFTLKSKPKGYKGIPDGKKIILFRWDKILQIRPDEPNPILSRWAQNVWIYAQDFIVRVKSLLESDIRPGKKDFEDLYDFFQKEYQRSLRYLSQKIENKNYKNWCELFIDFHTDKTCIDPFISFSTDISLAHQFAEKIDETVITIRTRWARILEDRYNIGRSNWKEVFVLWAVEKEEIVNFKNK